MHATSTATSWGWVARLFHWVVAGLVLFQIGLGVYMARLEDLIRQFELTQTHKSVGATVFFLALLRLAWRVIDRSRPRQPPAVPRWQARAAAASHLLLYTLLIVLPVSGWIYASASPLQDLLNVETMVFGAFALPDPWVPGNEGVARAARAVHGVAAGLLGGLLTAHVAAALKHHFIDRDDVFARMTWAR